MKYQLRKPKGRKYYNLTFTDPKTHDRVKLSTGEELKGEAEKFAFQYFKDYTLGQGKNGNHTIGELMLLMLEHYETHMPGRWEKMKQAWDNRMADKFAEVDARDLSFRDVQDYKTWCLGGSPAGRRWKPIATGFVSPGRKRRKLKKSTVNRDLATLSRMYSFAYETEQITYTGPKFIRYSELEYKRKGTVSQAEFDALCASNPPLWLRAMIEVAYYIANRRGELVELKVYQCDFASGDYGMVRLEADDTKNRKAKDGPMTPKMRMLLLECCAGKGPEDHVFTREDRGGPRRPIIDFRKLWLSLIRGAGIQRKILFHDFRRTAVTNMVRKGVPRKTAKAISGHTTDHVFDAYTQVSEQDIQSAVALIMPESEVKQ